MRNLEYNEDTDLFYNSQSSQAFASASDALWSVFFTPTSVAIFEARAMTLIVLERAASGNLSEQGIDDLAVLIRLLFYGYLRAVCEADDEEAVETCSMIDFIDQARKVWESALLKLSR